MRTPLREHWGAVVGVAFGLLLFLALVFLVQFQRAGAADGAALLGQWFEVGELPFGLVVTGAAELPDPIPGRDLVLGGRQAVRLITPDAPPEDPRQTPAKGEDGELERVDWARLGSGPEHQPPRPPREVLVVRYPAFQASSELKRLFLSDDDDAGGDDEDGGGPVGGRVTLERDRVRWGDFEARAIHERELESGGTFRDTMRVNLALGDRAIVLFARWPRGQPASKQRLEELLASLTAR
jgi:hypothetical protein